MSSNKIKSVEIKTVSVYSYSGEVLLAEGPCIVFFHDSNLLESKSAYPKYQIDGSSFLDNNIIFYEYRYIHNQLKVKVKYGMTFTYHIYHL